MFFPCEDACISLQKWYLVVEFQFSKNSDDSRCNDSDLIAFVNLGDLIAFVNLGSIAVVSGAKLATSLCKHLKK